MNHVAKRLGRRPTLPPILRPSTRSQSPAADAPARIGDVLALPSPDWLQQTVTFTGPDDQLAALREAAAGSGFVPWHIDYDRLEEDWIYRLHGSMTLHAAKILARELRDAVWQAHETALGGVISRAVPFDLHALAPVPLEVLRLGHDDPKALAWMWEHWGTTWSLRRVETLKGQGWRIRFCAADWTPWPVLRGIRVRWPGIEVSVQADINPVG